MPGSEESRTVGVEEYDVGREIAIEIDNIGEIGHGFIAFICWCGEDVRVFGRTPRWVNDIDRRIPTLKRSLLSEKNLQARRESIKNHQRS